MEENLSETGNESTQVKPTRFLEKTIENSLNFSLDATAKTDVFLDQTTTTSESNLSSGPSSPTPLSLTTSQIAETKDDQTNNSSITKSTVVITDSQILEFNNQVTDKFVEVEKQNGQNLNDTNSNNESQNDENNLNDLSMSKDDDEEEESDDDNENQNQNEKLEPRNEDKSSLEKQFSSEFTHLNSNEVLQEEANLVGSSEHLSDDYEKDYEITNVENLKQTDSINEEISGKLNEIKAEIDQDEKINANATKTPQQPQRNIEQEKFEEILGNDSLLRRITQYGIQDELAKSRPHNGQTVIIDYEAYLYVDKQVQQLVDSSDSLRFILGDGDVIPALDIVVNLMDKDEKCEIITDARHAFGALGKLPDIPPNATLFYKVHLIDFQNSIELSKMMPVERLALAESKKLRGNFHFNRQDFEWAIMSYKKGLKYLKPECLKGDEEEGDLKKFSELSQALLMNLALSNFKMNECREALNAIDQLLAQHTKHIKALYIKGKILLQMGETQESIQSLNASLQLDPNNGEVRKELTKAQAKHKMQYDNEKKLYKKMISGVSKTEEEQNKKIKSRLKNDKNQKNDSSLVGYLATGLFIAAASIGVAVFARYKNLI